ncbi:MAG: DUF3362 domain-containing protein [Lawsonibacter sp.]|nr:DUF3362 domain-containing protein [Lawsonibacter sp.]
MTDSLISIFPKSRSATLPAGTLATCMWYTGLDPRTMKPVFIPKSPHDKALQRALMQWRRPQNRRLVLEALHKTGREDLIGYGRRCLVKPDKGAPVSGGGHAAPPSRGRKDESRGGGPRAGSRVRGEKGETPARPVRKKGWAKPKKKR